jgi:thioredoxin reductase (NADPH)
MKIDADAIVIGAGPCGVAAAVQIKRSGYAPVVFEENAVGGLLRNANRVENYPGFPGGIAGGALCRQLERHLSRIGIKPVRDRVVDAAPVPDGYAIKTRGGRTMTGRTLIVAAGTQPVTGLFKEPVEMVGSRIFYEAADVPLDREGARVLVVGGGDAAYDYALNLAGRGAGVTIVRRGEARCLALLRERVRAHAAVAERTGASVVGLAAAENGVSVSIADAGGVEDVAADAVLIACGRLPRDELLHNLARSGKIANHLSPDLFAGGDVVRGRFRQAGIAVGDGLLAAMGAVHHLGGVC